MCMFRLNLHLPLGLFDLASFMSMPCQQESINPRCLIHPDRVQSRHLTVLCTTRPFNLYQTNAPRHTHPIPVREKKNQKIKKIKKISTSTPSTTQLTQTRQNILMPVIHTRTAVSQSPMASAGIWTVRNSWLHGARQMRFCRPSDEIKRVNHVCSFEMSHVLSLFFFLGEHNKY